MRHRKKAFLAAAALAVGVGVRATVEAQDMGFGPVDADNNGIIDFTVYGVGYGTTSEYDFDTIGDAMAVANLSQTRDRILVHAGTYDGSFGVSKNLTIEVDGNVVLRMPSAANGAIINISHSNASGAEIGLQRVGGAGGRLTLRPNPNAGTPNNQRGLSMTAAAAIFLSNTDFLDFDVTGSGGGMTGFHGTATGCNFTNCSASADGGAILGGVTVPGGLTTGTIVGCNFTDCHADGNGGAVSTVASISGGTASGCTADVSGGGYHNVAVRIGNPTGFLSTEITNCSAPEGGGIAFCDADIVNCDVTFNEATGVGGGGIAEVDGAITRCRIAGNTATNASSTTVGRGAGLYKCCVGLISNCQILANDAAGHGGGMFDCDANIKYCDFVMNHSDRQGGAAKNSNGVIRSSIFHLNTADTSGAMLDDCSTPDFCFVQPNWSTGTGNKKDEAFGPRFAAFNAQSSFTTWDLHLTTGSKCLNNAHVASDVLTDFENTGPTGNGQTRSTTAPDIGVDENSTL